MTEPTPAALRIAKMVVRGAPAPTIARAAARAGVSDEDLAAAVAVREDEARAKREEHDYLSKMSTPGPRFL